MFLPDVNVWLALAFECHAFHLRVQEWFETGGQSGCAFCRLTQQGFLRLATNPAALGTEAVTCAKAWAMYDRILQDTRILFLPEPAHLDSHWRRFSSSLGYSSKTWTDSYLVAFAVAAQLEIVTFDDGMRRTFREAQIVTPGGDSR